MQCGLTVLGKYTLIVTEKPDAANRIAMALDEEGKARKIVDGGVPYYQAYRNGDLVVVQQWEICTPLETRNKLNMITQFSIIIGCQDILLNEAHQSSVFG